MDNKDKSILTVIGYIIVVILILTNYEGLDYSQMSNKEYLIERYQEAKKIIITEIERIDLND